MKIGFLGPRGTFSEEATELWLQGMVRDAPEMFPFSSIAGVIGAVGKEVDMAIVPVENSLEGSVNITIDSFIHDVDAKIKGEVILPVIQNLFVRYGPKPTDISDIAAVYSHPQALYQCHGFLKACLPDAVLVETLSTAIAARKVAESDDIIAVIGALSLAKHYNLRLLAGGIQGSENNMTRFYVVASEDEKPTGRDKTTLVFSTENRPGSLLECLKVFAQNGINMTKIESRPSKRVLGEYIFFIEVEGHRLVEPLQCALKELKPKVRFCKVLGSYPISIRRGEGFV